MNNGGKWAKLMDPNEKSDDSNQNSNIVVTNKDQMVKRDYAFAQEKLNNELADFFGSSDSGNAAPADSDSGTHYNSESFQKLSETEKNLKMLKIQAFMNELKDKTISDFDRMNQLVDALEKIDDVNSTLHIEICEDLDWIISKIDNAKDAANHGILSRLIELNKIRPSKYIWRIFSASSQNNPPVAKALFKVLKPSLEENIKELEYNSEILKSCIFALSAISRSATSDMRNSLDWNGILESNNKNNEFLCNLLRELEDVPYNCLSKTEL